LEASPQLRKANRIKIIAGTMQAEMIRPFDVSASRKFMKYVPWWA